jgi:hypothetical protein
MISIIGEIGISILDILIGFALRMFIATLLEAFFKIKILFSGIPILGPVAFFAFPTELGLLNTLGFYLIDFVATIGLFKNLFNNKNKTNKENKDATTN